MNDIVLKKLLFLLILLLLRNTCFSQQIMIDSKIPNQPVFKAFPIIEENKNLSDLLKIFMIQDGNQSETALLGDYIKNDDTIIFKPQFELGEGLAFNVNYHYKNEIVKAEYKTNTVNFNTINEITVKEIYPKTNKIPKNILTFHVEFSEPMVQDDLAYMHINLYDENKKVVPHVWYNKSRWVTDKIMILMIHPGRVKNDISYFDHLGEIFTKGKKYSLEITNELKPQNPRSKLKPFVKKFEIVDASISKPKVLQNKIDIPKKNTLEKLKIVFDKPMDFYSILSGISINVYDTDNKVEGTFEQGINDQEWYFIPKKEWSEKKYTILFNKFVSDPSGNSLIKPFETKSLKASYTHTIAKKINFKPE